MRILIATDAWHPQVNGVVRTYERLAAEARAQGAEVVFLSPSEFRSLPCPSYRSIRLAIPNWKRADELIEAARPDFVHVATEGPVGLMARSFCQRGKRPFTTSYHTKFPEYASALLSIPPSWCFSLLRRFHNAGSGMMVATQSLRTELRRRGFKRLMPWTRGVDTDLYRPRDVRLFGSDQPVFLYVGRVSKEKNIEAFLETDMPGLKVVVGGGPHLPVLRRRFPDVIFTGPKTGEELAQHYASADVFVFPSRTDTFGLVAAGSDGLRRADRRLSCDRTDRRGQPRPQRRSRRRPRQGGTRRADAGSHQGAGRCIPLHLGQDGRAVPEQHRQRQRVGGSPRSSGAQGTSQRHAPGHAAAPRAQDQLTSQAHLGGGRIRRGWSAGAPVRPRSMTLVEVVSAPLRKRRRCAINGTSRYAQVVPQRPLAEQNMLPGPPPTCRRRAAAHRCRRMTVRRSPVARLIRCQPRDDPPGRSSSGTHDRVDRRQDLRAMAATAAVSRWQAVVGNDAANGDHLHGLLKLDWVHDNLAA